MVSCKEDANMRKTMLCAIDCDAEEREALRAGAERAGLPLVFASWGEWTAVPRGACVSVRHAMRVDETVLRALRARNVTKVFTRSVGVDHVDLAAAARLGISVRGVPYTPDCVAEYALTMMLMAARNLGAVLQRAREGDFRLEARRARELREMRVGVVGTGRIGARVIALLRAMGCTVAAYDRTHIANVNYLPLDKLLSWSDLVTLHLPLTPATRHILSEERLARMRPEALLVNVSRGGLIDTPALCNALEQGRLAGAALDVVEGEQDWFYHNRRGETPPFARLAALPNVILTPHMAFYTRRALEDVARNTVEMCLEDEGRAANG